MSTSDKIIVLIPAYKPPKGLDTLCGEIIAEGLFNIVVIDDGSGKDFEELFAALPSEVTLLRHEVNRGKGAALKTGISYVMKNMPECGAIVTCDADGQHRPKDIKAIAEAALEKRNTLVIGSRRLGKDAPLRSILGNRITEFVYFLSCGVRVHDTQSGLRAFSSELFEFMTEIDGDRYEYEMNVLLKTAKRADIFEIVIETVYIDNNSSSHFRPVRDAILIYKRIIKFSFASLVCFFIDYFLVLLLKWITGMSFSAETALLISVFGARAVSSLVNYLLNRNVVFAKPGRFSVLKYYILAVFIAGGSWGLLWVSEQLIGIPVAIAKPITDVLLFSVSYIVQKKLIFK